MWFKSNYKIIHEKFPIFFGLKRISRIAIYIDTALLVRFGIRQLYPFLRDKTSKNRYPGYDSKLHLVVWLQFCRSEDVQSASTLPLFPEQLGPGVGVLVRVPPIGPIDLLTNYSYSIGILYTIEVCANYLY